MKAPVERERISFSAIPARPPNENRRRRLVMNLNYTFNLIKAYKLGMYGADYAWILQETFEHQRWWESAEFSDCSLKNLHKAVESVLIVSSYNNIVGEEKSISGLVCDKGRKADKAFRQ